MTGTFPAQTEVQEQNEERPELQRKRRAEGEGRDCTTPQKMCGYKERAAGALENAEHLNVTKRGRKKAEGVMEDPENGSAKGPRPGKPRAGKR